MKIKVAPSENQKQVTNILAKYSLNTVCNAACCPNQMECFQHKTATFMIMGNTCTRNCTFCNIKQGQPEQLREDEPLGIAEVVQELQIKHVVVTSVTRDDLPDGGAQHFKKVVEAIRKKNSNTTIEVLIPDLKGSRKALKEIIQAKPHVINHNIETVPRLYPTVRPMAQYNRSMQVLKMVKEESDEIYTKSGIMVGLGEKEQEVYEVMSNLRNHKCDFLTIGQYLAPSDKHIKVEEYVHPEQFEKYKRVALHIGFLHVESGPFVRSSYHAERSLGKTEGEETIDI